MNTTDFTSLAALCADNHADAFAQSTPADPGRARRQESAARLSLLSAISTGWNESSMQGHFSESTLHALDLALDTIAAKSCHANPWETQQ